MEILEKDGRWKAYMGLKNQGLSITVLEKQSSWVLLIGKNRKDAFANKFAMRVKLSKTYYLKFISRTWHQP